MRRGRIFFYLAFIIILGLVAVYLVMQRSQTPTSLGTPGAEPTPAVQLVNVVVATQRIPRGSVLTDQVVSVVPIPQDLFIQGMFSDVNQVMGRLAKFDLDAGIPLTQGMLVDSAEQLSTTGSNAALSIPRGMVAVSIPISRLSSVSFAPQAGDHVNVMATMLFVDLDEEFQSILPNRSMSVISPGTGTLQGGTQSQSQTQVGAQGQPQLQNQNQGQNTLNVESSTTTSIVGGGGAPFGRAVVDEVLGQTFYQVPQEAQRPRLVSQALLQDVVVLRMGNFPLEGTGPKPTPTPSPEGVQPPAGQQTVVVEPEKPDVITLIVSPQDAITLNYLVYSGAQLTLALRPAGDDTRVQTEAVTLQFLLNQYNIPVPGKLPYGLEPRLDKLTPPVLRNDAAPTPAP